MTHDLVSSRHHLSASVTTAVLVVGAALSWSIHASAQEQADPPRSMEVLAPGATFADLEKAFWVCDHAATTRSPVDAGTAIVCVAITEELQKRKFNGDFATLLAWWRRNKAAEHQALEAAINARAAPQSDPIVQR